MQNVDQDGPACKAGLKSGDVVTAFNGKAVNGRDQFAGLIHASAPGSTVTLTVIRSGKTQDMKVKLGNWTQMAGPMPPHAADESGGYDGVYAAHASWTARC